MATYVRRVRVVESFDGQELVFMLAPMRYEHALHLKNTNGGGEQIIREYAQIFPGYVQTMTPFRDANGEEVPIEEIATGLFFVPLLGAVMRKHMEESRLRDPQKPVDVPVESSPASQAASDAASAG